MQMYIILNVQIIKQLNGEQVWSMCSFKGEIYEFIRESAPAWYRLRALKSHTESSEAGETETTYISCCLRGGHWPTAITLLDVLERMDIRSES